MNRQALTMAGTTVLVGILAACQNEPPITTVPLGTYDQSIYAKQVVEADKDDFVIYLEEWALDGSGLGPYGTQHLAEIAQRIASVNYPIVIETSRNAEVDAAHRKFILEYLGEQKVAIRESRVVVGLPTAFGTPGDEAAKVYQSQPQPSQNQGGGGTNGVGNISGSVGGY